jgi:hypothetical protein
LNMHHRISKEIGSLVCDAIDCDAHAPYWNWSAISQRLSSALCMPRFNENRTTPYFYRLFAPGFGDLQT